MNFPWLNMLLTMRKDTGSDLVVPRLDATGAIRVAIDGAVAGPQGDPGTPGSVWHSGSGAPAGGLGVETDYYLDTDNGDVYEKTGVATWTLSANIKGPNENLYNVDALGSVANISLIGPEIRTYTLTGNVTFSFIDIEQGRSITVFIEGDGVTRTLNFPVNLRFSGPIPTSLAANKFGVLSLVSLGTTVDDMRAIYSAEE